MEIIMSTIERKSMSGAATATRRAPPLRRVFPPLEAERAEWLRARSAEVLAAEPRAAEVERRLLDHGGHTVLLWSSMIGLDGFLAEGRYYPTSRIRSWKGEPSNCHGNAGLLYVLTQGLVRVMTGFALSADGLWRGHSWGVDQEDGWVVETTERRVRYYGYPVTDDDALAFFFAGTDFQDWADPAVLARAGRFIRQRISPDLAARIVAQAEGMTNMIPERKELIIEWLRPMARVA
jgi:hypothetical protein